ncbi:uncharacterized protein [Mytilus edulis]|uniref:uncharacterized protein n=1 Tax=Mytilus edulis TaxID=6550 RepID=UPI0039F1254A
MIFLPYLLLHIFVCRTLQSSSSSPNDSENEAEKLIQKVNSVTFLLTVNDTWGDCIHTVKTPAVVPGKKSQSIPVGKCDHGPLEFSVQPATDGYSLMSVHITFHSSVIVDASPPACDIPWNGTYLVPTKMTEHLPSLLPGCVVGDSREGYHMTYYWFYLLDWLIV